MDDTCYVLSGTPYPGATGPFHLSLNTWLYLEKTCVTLKNQCFGGNHKRANALIKRATLIDHLIVLAPATRSTYRRLSVLTLSPANSLTVDT